MAEEETRVEVPIIQAEFAEHLGKYRIKKEMVDTIAENIAEVGGATVFENPELLNEKLVTWSQYIGATLRKQILEHWFAKKGIPVSEETAEKFALSHAEAKKETKKEERKKKGAEGEVWLVKVDDKGVPRITMASEEETGITLDEAKKAVAEIRKTYVGEEPLVVFDESTQKHMPNFKSELVKTNPMLGWAAAKAMDRAAAAGEELDPMEVFIEQMARIEQMKAVVGGKETGTKGTISELIDGVKELRALGEEGKAQVPAWISDPALFIETVKRVSGEGARGAPDWMTDPIKFIEAVRAINPEPKTDEGLKTELAEVKDALREVKDERYREQITAQQNQLKALTDKYTELVDIVADLKRPVVGHTEMDILHEVATEGIGLAKTELSGFRRDLRDIFSSGGLPPTKTPEQRLERKQKIGQALEKDKRIEELVGKIFLGET